jgi:hypothetical protein
MRRVLAQGGRTVIAVAVVVVALTGAYAVASSSGGRTITVCVKKKTGVLFIGKCGKHTRKLAWNAAGRTGATGATGNTGLQGPGASVLTYDARARPTATIQPIGTVLGVTIGAECLLTNTGGASTQLYINTADGSLDVDFTESVDNFAVTPSTLTNSFVAPAGTLSAPTQFVVVSADAGDEESAHQIEFTELSPVAGYMVWHVSAQTTSSPTQTCHVSILYVPAAIHAAVRGAQAGSLPARRAPIKVPHL